MANVTHVTVGMTLNDI